MGNIPYPDHKFFANTNLFWKASNTFKTCAKMLLKRYKCTDLPGRLNGLDFFQEWQSQSHYLSANTSYVCIHAHSAPQILLYKCINLSHSHHPTQILLQAIGNGAPHGSEVPPPHTYTHTASPPARTRIMRATFHEILHTSAVALWLWKYVQSFESIRQTRECAHDRLNGNLIYWMVSLVFVCTLIWLTGTERPITTTSVSVTPTPTRQRIKHLIR